MPENAAFNRFMPEMTALCRFMPESAEKCRFLPENAGFCRFTVGDFWKNTDLNLGEGRLNPSKYKVHVGEMSTKGLLHPYKHWGFVGEMSVKSRRCVGGVSKR
ncbi:hypothetical protein LX64_01397 [Chitinophaga skermanii]|uniref:Uncharacterized protein n=1 Tax=Chitinophaga skermanii TaxID=331697 RepID=A0A327QZ84_9BACT|nr:hypothetical protein LX64_01397 [Chitinophaga skermanii]